jgi:hypothetical protein
LPIEVRNKIFFHYHHFCAVIGCPHAPVEEIKKIVSQKESFISFYPRLSKGKKDNLLKKIELIKETDFPDIEIVKVERTVNSVLYDEKLKDFSGIDVGIAYLFAHTLKGKRHTGNMNEILNSCLDSNIVIISIGDDYESPLVFINNSNQRAFICSSIKSKFNQSLIQRKIEVNNLTISIKQ